VLQQGRINVAHFARCQDEDRLRFIAAGDRLRELAGRLPAPSAALARREGDTLILAGELIASIGRTFAAIAAHQRGDHQDLRRIVGEEIDARERQLDLSGRIGFGGGVNPLLVGEDLQNMRLFLSHPAFPDVPAHLFSFTETPFSV
jgi:hypothetical protein